MAEKKDFTIVKYTHEPGADEVQFSLTVFLPGTVGVDMVNREIADAIDTVLVADNISPDQYTLTSAEVPETEDANA